MTDFRIALTTVPDEETGRRLARTFVEERLAACVSVSPAVTSFYWWGGKLVEDGEHVLIIKTRAALLDRLEARLQELHPYEVPEFVAIPVVAGSADYLRWLGAETRD